MTIDSETGTTHKTMQLTNNQHSMPTQTIPDPLQGLQLNMLEVTGPLDSDVGQDHEPL